MSRSNLNAAGAAGWFMADLFLIIAVLAGAGSTPVTGTMPSDSPTIGESSPPLPTSSSPEPSPTPTETATPGISADTRTDLGGDGGFDLSSGGETEQYKTLMGAILDPYRNGRYGRPGIVLVFGVANSEHSGTEVSEQAIAYLSQQPELNGVLFRAFKKDEGDPGELHAEAYYYPLS